MLVVLVLEILMEGEIPSMDQIALRMDKIVVGFVVILLSLDTSHNQLKLSNHVHSTLHLY